jgi:hypothetical protein
MILRLKALCKNGWCGCRFIYRISGLQKGCEGYSTRRTCYRGAHVLSIVATDIENKVTTQNINFEKTPPYFPIFAGETFYMPFDGIYTELITITPMLLR